MNKVALCPPVASAFAAVIEGDLAGLTRRGYDRGDRLSFAAHRKPGKPLDKRIDVGELLLVLDRQRRIAAQLFADVRQIRYVLALPISHVCLAFLVSR